MILNHVKLEYVVTSIKYIVSLIFLLNTLTGNKKMLPPSNLLNLLVLVEDELQKYLTILYFLSDLSGLKVNVLQANN